VLEFSLAPAQCAHSLKIAEDLGLDMREFRPVEIDLLKPPGQQVRRIRPLAGENREFGPANAQVARDALRFGTTTTIKFRYLPTSAIPISPPTKATKGTRPFTGLD